IEDFLDLGADSVFPRAHLGTLRAIGAPEDRSELVLEPRLSLIKKIAELFDSLERRHCGREDRVVMGLPELPVRLEGRDLEFRLRFEKVVEAALPHIGPRADVVHRRGAVAPFPNETLGGFHEPLLGVTDSRHQLLSCNWAKWSNVFSRESRSVKARSRT